MRRATRASGPAIKICGLTREQDVIAARDLGVWALGFVFAESSRRIEPVTARWLVESAGLGDTGGGLDVSGETGRPLIVGVFTDTSVSEIVQLVDEVGLDVVQLHSVNGPDAGEMAMALAERDRATLVIQAVPVDLEERDVSALRQAVSDAAEYADAVLLDARVSAGTSDDGGFGGTGRSFRWELAREAGAERIGKPLLVAGGINPENVLEAVSESGAWGVDVSSGVETAPGLKDAMLMERLVARVKEGRE